MKYRDPVTDRTLTDVKTRTAKGLFNISDWVRIHDNELHAYLLLITLNGGSVALHTLAVPTIATIPTVESINQLIENIELIRAKAYYSLDGLDTPLKTNWRAGLNATSPDYEDVNAWEAKLDLLRSSIVRAGEYRIFTGVANCGQARYYQYHWRTLSYVKDATSPVRRPRSGVGNCGTGLTWQNSYRSY